MQYLVYSDWDKYMILQNLLDELYYIPAIYKSALS